MSVFEMSFDELQRYQGTNPRPDDFDDYWRRALEELDGTEAKPELAPSEFSPAAAECFDLYFTRATAAIGLISWGT